MNDTGDTDDGILLGLFYSIVRSANEDELDDLDYETDESSSKSGNGSDEDE